MTEIRFFDEDENGESTRAQDMLGVEASGFDFPPEMTDERWNNRWTELDIIRANQRQREAETAFDLPIEPIGTTTGLFPVTKSRAWKADYLSENGREDEAFERDE